jgi:hypothetical protein
MRSGELEDLGQCIDVAVGVRQLAARMRRRDRKRPHAGTSAGLDAARRVLDHDAIVAGAASRGVSIFATGLTGGA